MLDLHLVEAVDAADGAHIKISGCPNGCGQHHLAGVGLQGSSYKVGKLEVPCYDIFVGGGGYQGAAKYGTRVTRVLAKKAHLEIGRAHV